MTLTDNADIMDIKVITAREKEIGMKKLQIYKKARVYAVVDENGNYSINTASAVDHGFTDFRQDGSWEPVAFDDAPSWLKDQISDFDLFEKEV